MSKTVLGIDTSNYTTSVSIVQDAKVICNHKILLDVAKGNRGIRQSDAVFQHTKNLPVLFEKIGKYDLSAIGVSVRPRDLQGSYMPCFLAGYSAASALAQINGIKRYELSHQAGHIMAALYSCERLDLADKRFLAFHVSGGTTEMLLVDKMSITKIGGTLDLNAGQLIDRIGVKMGYDFPCGKKLESISLPMEEAVCTSCVRGNYCHLSGLENQADKMMAENCSHPEVAAFVIKSILRTLDKMTENAFKELGELPVVYAGGVMSNSYISKYLSKKYMAFFAEPEFSCDNAAGVALLAYYHYICN